MLRRIIRRAIRHGYKLGARAAFFHKMVPDLVAEMGSAYPELKDGERRIMDVLRQEEERFFATIENGMAIVEAELAAMEKAGNKVFDGDTAFKLHDTFGFPLDLTADICREREVTVDALAFDAAMARQKEQARAAGKFKMAANLEYDGPETTFHGYTLLEEKGNILALYKDGAPVNELLEGEMGVVVLDHTRSMPSPAARLATAASCALPPASSAWKTRRRSRPRCSATTAWCATGKLAVGQGVAARVDVGARAATARNHSVTHLMHKALREVSAPTCSRRARWSIRTRPASTSSTPGR